MNILPSSGWLGRWTSSAGPVPCTARHNYYCARMPCDARLGSVGLKREKL